MAHQEQLDFFLSVKAQFPEYFHHKSVLDCGSLDVNGNLRHLFEDCSYVGVDHRKGSKVNVVSLVHELPIDIQYDVVVSGEMLEHDQYWWLSLRRMFDLLVPDGLLAISAAGFGRAEHGTQRSDGHDWGTSLNYYSNILEADFYSVFDLPKCFKKRYIGHNLETKDIYFWGIKC